MAINAQQQDKLLTLLKAGKSLRQACEAADIDPPKVLELAQTDDTFGQHYAHARRIGWTLHADDLEATAEDMSIPADHKRIMVDTRKWMLSKMLPKIYGDRLDLNHSGKVTTATELTRDELMAIAAKGK